MKNNRRLIHTVLLGMLVCTGVISGCSEKMAPSNSVRMAVPPDYPPYAYLYQGKLTGIDLELGEMIAKEAGRELRIVNGNFSELVDLVRQKKADMAICALAITPERREAVLFSDPYEFAGQTFLVRSGENIRYLTDMKGKTGFRVGAETGSTGYTLIAKYLQGNAVPIRLTGYVGNREAVKALLQKQNDAVILDPLVARCLQMEYPGKLEILRDLLNHEEFAVAVSRGDPSLLAAANRVIHRLWKSGELYALQEKHMKQSLTAGGRNVH